MLTVCAEAEITATWCRHQDAEKSQDSPLTRYEHHLKKKYSSRAHEESAQVSEQVQTKRICVQLCGSKLPFFILLSRKISPKDTAHRQTRCHAAVLIPHHRYFSSPSLSLLYDVSAPVSPEINNHLTVTRTTFHVTIDTPSVRIKERVRRMVCFAKEVGCKRG